MDEEILKNRVGRTPMIRANKLEEDLGIKNIYLKLEGNNPSGHREDRLAYLMIRDATSRRFDTITMGTYGTVGGSLSYLSRFFDINLVFYVPDIKKILRKDLMLSDRVELREHGNTYEECVMESRKIARENNWYDANPGLENNMMNMYAFSYIANESNTQIEGEIDTIWCQTSGGSSISGLHLGFKQMWVTEEIHHIPVLMAVSTSHGNALVESFKKGLRNIEELDRKQLKETSINRNTVNWKCFNGQEALNSIYDSDGKAIGVSDEEVKRSAKIIRDAEKLKITAANAYPVAAFMKEAEEGNIEDGNHVIILNDGKVGIDIRVMEKQDLNIGYEEFLKLLDEWLVIFSDPMEEIREAVDNAFEHGYVICAMDRNKMVGIAILSRSHWEVFFPQYHLSYIATKKDLKGKGIATQLISKALQLSKGSLSLHVETDNKRALKLYEKMGFTRKYYRMIYGGGSE